MRLEDNDPDGMLTTIEFAAPCHSCLESEEYIELDVLSSELGSLIAPHVLKLGKKSLLHRPLLASQWESRLRRQLSTIFSLKMISISAFWVVKKCVLKT